MSLPSSVALSSIKLVGKIPSLRNSCGLFGIGYRDLSFSSSATANKPFLLLSRSSQDAYLLPYSSRVRLQSGHLRRLLHTATPSSDIFTVQDEADFKAKVLDSKRTVIVEFHATWCGPCKLLMPRMEKSALKYKDQVDMAKVDIDDHPDLAMNFNVGAVPSVLALKNGEVLDKFVGLKDDDQIDTFIASALKNKI